MEGKGEREGRLFFLFFFERREGRVGTTTNCDVLLGIGASSSFSFPTFDLSSFSGLFHGDHL